MCERGRLCSLVKPCGDHQQVVGGIGRRAGRLLLLEASGAVPVHLRVRLVLVLVAAAAGGEVGLRRRAASRVGEVRGDAVVAALQPTVLCLPVPCSALIGAWQP